MSEPRQVPVSRRQLLALAASAPLAGGSLAGCARPGPDFAAAGAETWRHAAPDSVRSRDDLLREIVRYGTLAPSHRNRQPWRFEIGPGWISVRPDPARRLPVADPDDRYLQISIGAAVENLVTSAAAGGLGANVAPDGDGLRVDFFASMPAAPDLYEAIITRQTAWTALDPQPIEASEQQRLATVTTGNGIKSVIVTDRQQLDRLLDLTITAGERQARDPAWIAEFVAWLRLGPTEALARRDGLASFVTGFPSVPRWLASRLPDLVITPARAGKRHTNQLRGCSGVLVLASDGDTVAAWQEAGRRYQRAALVAEAGGIRTGPVNAALDYPDLRRELASVLGLGDLLPVMVVRFGRGGETLPRSLRRPVADLATGPA
jgi:nitroreductase